MPKKTTAKAGPKPSPAKLRLWLMYPPKLITNPVIWELARKFPVVTNVRQASVTDEIGIVCLEICWPAPRRQGGDSMAGKARHQSGAGGNWGYRKLIPPQVVKGFPYKDLPQYLHLSALTG